MRLLKLPLSIAFVVGVLQASPISLTPGSIIVEQAGSPFTTSYLEAFSTSGGLSATERVTGANQIVNGLAVLNGSLYFGDGAGFIDRVNLTSGLVTSSFSSGSILAGLGTINGNLVTFNIGSIGAAFHVFSPSGLLLQTVSLSDVPSTSLASVTSDGTYIYVADLISGRIYKYSLTGALIDSFDTQTGSGMLNAGLEGITYSSINNSLWMTDAKTDQVIDFSLDGNRLAQISTGAFAPINIAVVPETVSVPEPGWSSGLLLAFAMAGCASKRVLSRC